MIHHYSIPINNPKNVAQVLEKLFNGIITGFRPYANAYIVWMKDEFGTGIELYPIGTEMVPDKE